MVQVNTAHCTEGTSNGPLSHFCEGFVFEASTCAAEVAPVRPCEQYETCGECVNDELCGFCEDTGKCQATCDGCTFYHTEICPGRVDCGGYTRAYNCLRDRHCGFCDDDQACKEGDMHGPTASTCSKWHTLSRWYYGQGQGPDRNATAAMANEKQLLGQLGALLPQQAVQEQAEAARPELHRRFTTDQNGGGGVQQHQQALQAEPRAR